MSSSPIVVFPATARSGSQAAKLLLQSGQKVRAVARNPSKASELKSLGAEVVEGDLSKPETIKSALKDAKALFFINPPDFSGADVFKQAEKTAETLKDALEGSEIQRVVLLSSIGAQLKNGTGNISTVYTLEQALKGFSDKIEIIFLRAASFIENWQSVAKLAVSPPHILPSLSHPVDRAFAQVSTSDIGAAASKYLQISSTSLTSNGSKPTIVELSGPEDLSPQDIANLFEKINGGIKVNAFPVKDEEFESTLEQNLPKNVAGHLAELWRAFNNGTIDWVKDEGVIKERGESKAEVTLRGLIE